MDNLRSLFVLFLVVVLRIKEGGGVLSTCSIILKKVHGGPYIYSASPDPGLNLARESPLN